MKIGFSMREALMRLEGRSESILCGHDRYFLQISKEIIGMRGG